MTFYVPLPEFPGGCPPIWYVVEGRVVQGGSPEAKARHFSNPSRPVILFDAPTEAVRSYGGFYADMFGGWAECEGPARKLEGTEYDRLVRGLRRSV